MNPPSDEGVRRRYEIAFWVIGIIGVAIVVLAALRSGDLQESIAQLQEQLRHTRIHVSVDTLGVAPSERFDPLHPFQQGRSANFNIGYRNVGSASAMHVTQVGKAWLTRSKPNIDDVFDEMIGAVQWEKFAGTEIVPQAGRYMTARTDPLSKDDLAAIASGKAIFYVIGAVRFEDDTGAYQQELCQWLQPPGTSPVWHECRTHNTETLLRAKR